MATDLNWIKFMLYCACVAESNTSSLLIVTGRGIDEHGWKLALLMKHLYRKRSKKCDCINEVHDTAYLRVCYFL